MSSFFFSVCGLLRFQIRAERDVQLRSYDAWTLKVQVSNWRDSCLMYAMDIDPHRRDSVPPLAEPARYSPFI
jgi:hypothetical protein